MATGTSELPTTVIVIRKEDIGYGFALRELIGVDRAKTLRAGQHPLGQALRALARYERGGALIGRQQMAMQSFVQDAKLIWKHAECWRDHEDRFVSDLLDANECRSILFELHVIGQNLEGAIGGLTWQRYVPSAPDVSGEQPPFGLECKFAAGNDFSRVLKKLREAAKQHDQLGVSLVVAVGLPGPFPRDVDSRASRLAKALHPWFERHPEVAAAIIYTPTARGPLGTGAYRQGYCRDIISRRATHPLPAGFSFMRTGTVVL